MKKVFLERREGQQIGNNTKDLFMSKNAKITRIWNLLNTTIVKKPKHYTTKINGQGLNKNMKLNEPKNMFKNEQVLANANSLTYALLKDFPAVVKFA